MKVYYKILVLCIDVYSFMLNDLLLNEKVLSFMFIEKLNIPIILSNRKL